MRFKPRSRPSGLNHSWVVCAPPPWPPAPIEMAGMPSGKGMLGSVGGEARGEGVPRGGLTPRVWGKVRGGGGWEVCCGEGGAGRGADLANLPRHLAAGGALILDFQRALD